MILITGATGFIGRKVVKALYSQGSPQLRCLVRSPLKREVLQEYPVEFHTGDVTDPTSLKAAFQGVEKVIHMVAIIREDKNYSFEAINHLGTKNVVEVAKGVGVKHLIHLSAIGVTEDPAFGYSYTKWLGEQEIINSGIPYTIIRPSIQFGEGDEFINSLAGLVKASPIVPIAGDGKNLFQPIWVEDTASCVARAVLGNSYYNRVMEIGGPDHLGYDQIIDTIVQEYGVRRLKLHVPVPVMGTLLGFMERALPRAPATREQLKYLKIDNVTGLDSVEKGFGLKPVPLRGNIGYIHKIGFTDALKMSMGFMPKHVRDH